MPVGLLQLAFSVAAGQGTDSYFLPSGKRMKLSLAALYFVCCPTLSF